MVFLHFIFQTCDELKNYEIQQELFGESIIEHNDIIENNFVQKPADNSSNDLLNEALINKTPIIRVLPIKICYDEDYAYGQYVAERLKSIKDTNDKLALKLKIDFLFCKSLRNTD